MYFTGHDCYWSGENTPFPSGLLMRFSEILHISKKLKDSVCFDLKERMI